MPRVEFDANFNHHPKILAAGPLAQLLHMKAIIYCGQHRTGGFVPDEAVNLLLNWGELTAAYIGDSNFFEDSKADLCRVYDSDLTERLVAAGLWQAGRGGWWISTDPWWAAYPGPDDA